MQVLNQIKEIKNMLLDYYEEALKELEELEINLNKLSNDELSRSLQSIVDRGWRQIETLFGQRQEKKYSKEEIQKHFNDMLNVVPMTRIKRNNDKT
tara:strand:- start:132 stop:419 length:288 start_codon:yes stop_codon:yes gene_type:complete